MCKICEKSDLEFGTSFDLLEFVDKHPKKQEVMIIRSNKSIKFLHPSCTHPASVPCGTGSHRGTGHGWCYYCKKCNPR